MRLATVSVGAVRVCSAHALILLLLSACATSGGGPTPNQPTDPQIVTLTLVVMNRDARLPGATVQVDDKAPELSNGAGWYGTAVTKGTHRLRVTKDGFQPIDMPVEVPRHKRVVLGLQSLRPPVQPVTARLTTDRRIFRQNGQPWRWKGVSAFRMLDDFAHGRDIQPVLDAFRGYNLLRVWLNVGWTDPQGNLTGWRTPSAQQVIEFLAHARAAGFYVELTLLTDNLPAHLAEARALLPQLIAANPMNLLIEIANEPHVNQINTALLKSALEASPFLYASGDYYNIPEKIFGRFGVAHTDRGDEWPRKSHALMEYFKGGGPWNPTDPPHPFPWVGDEPKRPDQAGYNEQDYLTYFATSSLFGAGATFHYEGGKWGRVPDANEAKCAAAALRGLNAFPGEAPFGAYGRPVDKSLVTYIVGTYMVRVRPTTPTPTPTGWVAVDDSGTLWRRP